MLGDHVEDVVVWLRGPLRAGTDNPATVHRTRGGSAAKVARFLGRVGADELGDVLTGRLRACGVDVRVQRGGRTGSVVVLVHEDGERTMLPDRGACAGLGPADIAPAVLFANSAEADVLGLADRAPPAGTTFVIKGGAAPTTVRRGCGEETRMSVPAYRRARDTTGDGDAFAAGYLASAIAGDDACTAVRAGHRLAARVLDAPGASFATEPHMEAT